VVEKGKPKWRVFSQRGVPQVPVTSGTKKESQRPDRSRFLGPGSAAATVFCTGAGFIPQPVLYKPVFHRISLLVEIINEIVRN